MLNQVYWILAMLGWIVMIVVNIALKRSETVTPLVITALNILACFVCVLVCFTELIK